MSSILSAEITFKHGEHAIRSFGAQFGTIEQYLVPHFTLLYGCEGLNPSMKEHLVQFENPDHAIYTDVPKPVSYAVFVVPTKGYQALAVKYEWPAGKNANIEAASNPMIFPKGPTSGFNGDKFAAHVTFAYVSLDKVVTVEMLEKKQPDMSFFDCTVDKITLEVSVKRRRVEKKD